MPSRKATSSRWRSARGRAREGGIHRGAHRQGPCPRDVRGAFGVSRFGLHADPSASCAPSYARRSLHTHGDKERCKTNDDQSGRPGGEPGAADAAQCCNRGPASVLQRRAFCPSSPTTLSRPRWKRPAARLPSAVKGWTVSELSVQTGEVKINGSSNMSSTPPNGKNQESLFKRLVR